MFSLAETVALLPIATMIHLILGVMIIILVFKSQKSTSNERFAGLIIGWLLFTLGILWFFRTVIDYQFANENITNDQYSESFLRFGNRSVWLITVALASILPLVFPYPVIQNTSVVLGSGALIGVITIVLVPFGILTGFRFEGFNVLMYALPFLIWIAVYLRYLFSEMLDDRGEDRLISSVAALMIISVFAEWMTYWMGIVTTQENHFTARFTVEGWEVVPVGPNLPSTIAWQVGQAIFSTSIIVLFSGEMWRIIRKGFSGVSLLTMTFFVLGILWFIFDYTQMGIIDSCVETACESMNETYLTWYVFTSQIIRYLGVPLLFMYVILNFNLIETEGENVWFTRVLVLLMLLIVTSSIIELIQTVLPIPQMITSALFAAAVVIFIGWEEKITNGMIRRSESISGTLLKLGEVREVKFEENQYRVFSIIIGISLVLALMISFLISMMEISN